MPGVLTIAGSDNSGGAGIEADIKTITAQGCYALTCICALTCQTPDNVYSSVSMEEKHVSDVLDNNLASMRCDAVKIGMLTMPALLAVVKHIDRLSMPIVLDPVMVATSGSSLSEANIWTSQEMRTLLQRVKLLTPNIPEAHLLVGEEREIRGIDDLVTLAKTLVEKCGCNVLLKGGHSPIGNQIVDVLCYGDEVNIYRSEQIHSNNLHGTGCTLSSCIASRLAYGDSVKDSVFKSIQYVHNAIACGENINVSNCKQNGPLNHVYQIAEGRPHRDKVEMDYESMLLLPSVKQSWDNYIDHEFVKMVSDGTMDLQRFHRYLRQDYNYLEVFAQIHAKLAADTTDKEHFKAENAILQNVLHEMAKQEQILGPEIKTLVKSPQMLNYTGYLREVAEYGTWDQLYTATMPCCLGYVFAVRKIAPHIKVTQESHPELYSWLQEYLNPDFYAAALKGIQTLDTVLRESDDANTLVRIFQEVCDLECKFWDQ